MAETQAQHELSGRELDEVLGKIIVGLSEPEGLPREALQLAARHWEAALPVFLEALDEYLGDPVAWQEDADLMFFFVHLCGQMRETRAYRPLMRLAALPRKQVDPVLGDAVTVTLHQVTASLFDGDPAPMHAVILSEEADQYVRTALLEALAFLTEQGRIPLEDTKSFLIRCSHDMRPRKDSYTWVGWQTAISFLGLHELRGLVKQAFEDDRIGPEMMDFEDFEQDLQARTGREGEHDAAGYLRYFGNVADELAHWHCFTPEGMAELERGRLGADADQLDPADDLLSDTFATPYVNPMRGVGRNDPCPCGSGKKYKKCCLN